MATATLSISEGDLCCSICLDIFNQPATIPCGHTFCIECIKDFWKEDATVYSCPICQMKYYTPQTLYVNTCIAEMTANLKRLVLDVSSSAPEQQQQQQQQQLGNGNIPCGMCADAAVKSCLDCSTSFCANHLDRHHKNRVLMKHRLITAVENLDNWICKHHDEPLEQFCNDDKMFLCKLCNNKDHKKHKVVDLEEAAKTKKTQMQLEQNYMDGRMKMCQDKIRSIEQLVEASKLDTKDALKKSKEKMADIIEWLRKCQDELSEVVQTKQRKAEKKAESFIKELKDELQQIQLKRDEHAPILAINDTLTFLEKLKNFDTSMPQEKDWSGMIIDTDLSNEIQAIKALETAVIREVSKLCDPRLKERQLHAVDVTLDHNTAHPSLFISADEKRVWHGDKKKNLTHNPERFEDILNVLAKEGFDSSRRCYYYETQVKDKTQWDLGIAKQSVNRQDVRQSPKNGYWTISLRKGNEFTANSIPPMELSLSRMPQKVGVFVDYKEGLVSFYDADNRAHIFSFPGCNFTEKLLPFFSPGALDGGKNSAPLILTPVEKKAGGAKCFE